MIVFADVAGMDLEDSWRYCKNCEFGGGGGVLVGFLVGLRD